MGALTFLFVTVTIVNLYLDSTEEYLDSTDITTTSTIETETREHTASTDLEVWAYRR